MSSPELNISLEPHLIGVLVPLPPLLPAELATKLTPFLSDPRPPTVPYTFLQNVSQWSRSAAGSAALQAHSPQLDQNDYTMVALLAGTTTSPERIFPQYTPPKEPAELERQKQEEKKAITTLMNALLSIGGTGFAAWWAAGRTGWKNEWVCCTALHLLFRDQLSVQRVLFALFVATVVAISEAVLYIIWQSRRSTAEAPLRTRRKLISADHKKDDRDTGSDADELNVGNVMVKPDGLRQRTVVSGTREGE